MSSLIFFRHGVEVLHFRLDSPRVVIGRGDRCDLVLPDERVSRRQLAVSVEEGTAFLEDLSGNGTMVNRQEVRGRAPLPDGAAIALGEWTAVWRAGGTGSDSGRELAEQVTVRRRPEAETTQAAPVAACVATPLRLRIREESGERELALGANPVTLGKDASNDVVLADPFVSAKHLRIVPNVPSAGLCHVEDLRSTNGSYLGKTRLYEADVPNGSVIRLGGTELVIESVEGARVSQSGILGADPAIRELLGALDRIAPSDAAVAVLGESGSGKELVARAIHQKSRRADGPFVPVNCAAISKTLIESELFGHEKGAFTDATSSRKGAFEEADGGTLFLDEIGELPLEVQATLLRALESGEVKRVGASRPTQVDVRVVVATNVDLLTAVHEKRFREDLYYRVCVVPVQVPPLRARRGDIPVLAQHFLKAFAPPGSPVRLTDEALWRLQAHPWPGNVRELRNVIHRGLLLRKGTRVDAGDLVFDEPARRETPRPVAKLRPGMNLEQTIQAVEREVVEDCLLRNGDNRERAARELGLARSALFKRLREWGKTG